MSQPSTTETKTVVKKTAQMIPRRTFLRGAAAFSVTAGVTMAGFRSTPAEAAECGSGPRSLVCVFLAGGADSFNMFVPYNFSQSGSDWATFAATRGDLAPARGSLLPVSNGSFAFAAQLPSMRAMYNSGSLAVVSNVGPLVRPTTPADFMAERNLPQSLFAHDAQQRLWETAETQVSGTSQGWGGQIAGHIDGCDPASPISPGISISGSATWQSSANSPYLRLSPSSSLQRMGGYDPSILTHIPQQSRTGVANVLEQALQAAEASPNALTQEAARLTRTSILTSEELQDATADNAANAVAMGGYGANGLAAQLHVVARLIKARNDLNMSKQVFFVRLGGWDTHSNQNERLPVLMADLDEALGQFNYAMGSDGLGVADTVTTFTASDFGRTLTSNGNGSDHAWGGHAFVMGGAVNGGRVVGDIPSFRSTNNPDDIGSDFGFAGRIIPTTSVSQMAATLARWTGVEDSALNSMFPELSNFPIRDLGLF